MFQGSFNVYVPEVPTRDGQPKHVALCVAFIVLFDVLVTVARDTKGFELQVFLVM